MNELEKEFLDDVYKHSVHGNRVIVHDELLITVLAVAYKIEPTDVYKSKGPVDDVPVAIYRDSEALQEAISEFYSHASRRYLDVNEFVSWKHNFMYTARYW